MVAFTIDSPQHVFVILGNGLSPSGILPEHVIKRLNAVSMFYHSLPAEEKPLLVTCGKWSFWNRRGITPRTTEAEAMQEYLIRQGVDRQQTLTETDSEDTIGNALVLKKLLKGKAIKDLTIVCADFHKERVQYIFTHLLQEFHPKFVSTSGPYTEEELHYQKQLQRELLERQKPFIQELLKYPMEIENLYDHPYYVNQLKGDITPTGLTALGVFELSRKER